MRGISSWIVAVGFGLVGASTVRAGLLHFYPFDSGATDAAGTADGVLSDGATVSGGTLTLNGTTGFVQFGGHLVPTSGSYTVALFERASTLATSYTEMISQGSSGGPGFYIGKDSAAGIRVTDSWGGANGEAFPPDGLWHHFALVVDGAANTSTLYIDGLARQSIGFAIATNSGGGDTRLGRQFAPYDEFFPGSLDDVRIYDNALSAREVAGIAGVPEPVAALPLAMAMGAGLLGRRRRSR